MKQSKSSWSDSLLRLVLYPFFARYVKMPGKSYRGAFATLEPVEAEIARRSRELVTVLADGIGERSINAVDGLNSAADFIEATFFDLGYSVVRQAFDYRGIRMYNLIAELPGYAADAADSEKVLVLGADVHPPAFRNRGHGETGYDP